MRQTDNPGIWFNDKEDNGSVKVFTCNKAKYFYINDECHNLFNFEVNWVPDSYYNLAAPEFMVTWND